MSPDYLDLLSGKKKPLPLYPLIVNCLENLEVFPYLVEPLYQQAVALGEEEQDALRFGLVRLQIYADVHRTEDLEQAQQLKYVAQVLEKVIFGSLMLEKENYTEE